MMMHDVGFEEKEFGCGGYLFDNTCLVTDISYSASCDKITDLRDPFPIQEPFISSAS
jgi:hypothetical protein